MMVRQCHSPDSMARDATAAEVVERKLDARETAADGGEPATDGGQPADTSTTPSDQPADKRQVDGGGPPADNHREDT